MKNKEAKSIFSSLENFSVPPPPELWDKIEAELDKPKKKKRPIIWWWVAAGLVAGLSLPTIWDVTSNQGNSKELNIENNVNKVVLQDDSKDNKNDNENRNGGTIGKSSFDQKKDSANEAKKENLNTNSISLTNSNSVAVKTNPVIIFKTKDFGKFKNSKDEKSVQSIVEGNDKSQADALAVNKNATANNYNSASFITKNNSSQINKSNKGTETIVSTEKSSVPESLQHKESTKNTNYQSPLINQNTEVSGVHGNKAIAENKITNDSLNKIKTEVAQLENALVALDKDKTKKKTSPEIIDKWSLQVFAGVMGSENYNNEKVLGNTVASQQTNGYGVKTNYKLNKKWAVSSGFKISELGQKIEGVSYYDGRESSSILKTGFLPAASNDVPTIAPKNNNIVFVSNNENYLFTSNSFAATGFEKGDVTQNLKYFEMPLEISYSLLSKKKTNISMNTGGFVGKLISNEILLNGNSIGENNNVSEYIYGTLLSSTLQYEFYKKTKFFIEPGMNYYINPMENQSFNQFQWMFNVGINVSF